MPIFFNFFNQTNEYFPDSTYRGHVVLNTKEGGNFYFTPLGKSYVCENGDDQGPLRLYNQVRVRHKSFHYLLWSDQLDFIY